MSDLFGDAPGSVKNSMDAIRRVNGGQFLARLNTEWQYFAASNYAAPFFAISLLAPEILSNKKVSILFADQASVYSNESGRWLSLYAKLLNWSGKVLFTICTPIRPKVHRPPKPLLFQLAQQVLVKKWDKHLVNGDVIPDIVIIPISGDSNEIKNIIQTISSTAKVSKYIIGCHYKVEAILLRSYLELYGCITSEIVGHEKTSDIKSVNAISSWWISAKPPESRVLVSLENEIKHLKAYDVMRRSLKGSTRSINEASALVYASSAQVEINGEVVLSIQINTESGIDITNGRRYHNADSANSSDCQWDDSSIDNATLSIGSTLYSDEQSDSNRLDLILWLGQVLSEPESDELYQAHEHVSEFENNIDEINKVEIKERISTAESLPADSSDKNSILDNVSLLSSLTESKSKTPIRSRLQRGAGPVNVLAIAARIGKINSDKIDTFNAARACITTWLNRKGFTDNLFSNNSHIESLNGEVVVETDDEAIWSIRFDDRKSMNQGSIWRVEATLLRNPTPAFGLRLIQIRSSEDSAPPPLSGVPQFVVQIAKNVGLEDAGVHLSDKAVRITGITNSQWLSSLLINPSRTQPVIVISGKIDASADRLATRLAGVAHVVCIDDFISDHLINIFGKNHSVYGRAIRLYRPGFSPESNAYDHPIWNLAGPILPKWIANDIFEEACAISLEVDDLEERVPSFQSIRNILSEYRLAASNTRLDQLRVEADKIASSSDEKISRLIDVIEGLEAALAEQQGQATRYIEANQQLDRELHATRKERNMALEELRQIKYQYSTHWNSLDSSEQPDSGDDIYFPETWDDLEEWVKVYGQNKLYLHPLAAKAARESPFKDIPFAYKALDYLVRYYVPMRTRRPDDMAPFTSSQKALEDLGLELSKVGTALDDKRYKHEYRRQYKGRDILLEDHLKWGVGFDPETLFRLYFYYDETDAIVVVGHMPTHLTNRITHST
jgi:hypothetical protein